MYPTSARPLLHHSSAFPSFHRCDRSSVCPSFHPSDVRLSAHLSACPHVRSPSRPSYSTLARAMLRPTQMLFLVLHTLTYPDSSSFRPIILPTLFHLTPHQSTLWCTKAVWQKWYWPLCCPESGPASCSRAPQQVYPNAAQPSSSNLPMSPPCKIHSALASLLRLRQPHDLQACKPTSLQAPKPLHITPSASIHLTLGFLAIHYVEASFIHQCLCPVLFPATLLLSPSSPPSQFSQQSTKLIGTHCPYHMESSVWLRFGANLNVWGGWAIFIILYSRARPSTLQTPLV